MAKRLDIFDVKICEVIIYIFSKINFNMPICQGVSPSIGRRDMYYSLLDSSHQGASNGGRIMSLASLYGKLFAFYCFEFFEDNSSSIDPRNMKRPPFDASRQGESNKLRFIIFWSRDSEIIRFKALKKRLSGDFW